MLSNSIIILIVALVTIVAVQRSETRDYSRINLPHLRFNNNQYKRMQMDLSSRNVDTEEDEYEDLNELARDLWEKRDGTGKTLRLTQAIVSLVKISD